MNYNERFAYLCKAGGKTEGIIKKYFEDGRSARKQMFDFADKHGADQIYANNTLQGLCFTDEPDMKKWIKVRGVNAVYRPRKLKGSEIYVDFISIPSIPRPYDLAEMMGVERTLDPETGTIFYPLPEVLGERVIVQLYIKTIPPQDCALIPLSQYFTWQEAEVLKNETTEVYMWT